MLWIVGFLLGCLFFWWTTTFKGDIFGLAPLLLGVPGFFIVQWLTALVRVWGIA